MLQDKKIKIISFEIILVNLYGQEKNFFIFVKLLDSFGYHLFNINNLNISPSGQLTHIDVVYITE